MANNWVVADLTNALAFAFGQTTTAVTLPIKVALDTGTGSSTVVGTEVTGGSYVRQSMGITTTTAGQISNSGVITFAGMPAVSSPGVQGLTIWDTNATTPVRKWSGPLVTAKTTNAGDTLSFAIAAIVCSAT